MSAWWKGTAIALAVVATACDGSITGEGTSRRSVIAFDLSGLHGVTAGEGSSAGSVANRVTLSILDANGREQTLDRVLARADSLVTFEVTVEQGDARFDAALLSDIDTVLASQSATASITEDGFQVDLPLAARTAILVIAPDTLVVSSNTPSASLVLSNRGSRTLPSWSIDPVQSPQGPCSGCPVFEGTGGEGLRPGESTRVLVYKGEDRTPRTYSALIRSTVGNIRVWIRVE